MRLALLLLAGCLNPLIPPGRVTTPENEQRRGEAAAFRKRADELGAAHPIARRYYLGLAALRAGGPVPPIDLTAVSPEVAVKLTGVACPVLERGLKIAQPGNPALHVDLEVSVEACGVEDHVDRRTEYTHWSETVVDRVETKQDYQLDCHVQQTGGETTITYSHELGDPVVTTRTSPRGSMEVCDKIPYLRQTPITHEEPRTGSHVIANHVVKLAIDAVWFARRGGATEDAGLHARGSNESERSIEKSADDVMAEDAVEEAVAIRGGIAKLLAKEIAAEEALARAAGNPDDADEHWARAIALGGRDNPLAKRAPAETAADLPLRLVFGPELQDPPQPDRNTYDTRVAADLAAVTTLRVDLQYEDVAGAHGELAGLSYIRNVMTRRTTERGVQAVDAAIGSAAIGYADGLAWDLSLGYGLGFGWRDGRGSGFSIGMRALSRITRLGDAQVYYTAVPVYARLELALPHGSIALDATGYSVSGRDLWRGSVLLTTQSDRYYLPGHYWSLTAERARVHGRDKDTDLGAPELTTFWLQLGAKY